MRHRESDQHTSSLHEERMERVLDVLLAKGCKTVIDLGCGAGHFLARLATESQFEKILGIDQSGAALAETRALFESAQLSPAASKVVLLQTSFTTWVQEMAGFDAAVMIETLEHIEPRRLSLVESTVFRGLGTPIIIVTTPNREYNVLHGLPAGALRHADHQFEWTREKFTAWASGVAQRNGYQVSFAAIGAYDSRYGSSTQMATFVKKDFCGNR